MIGVWADDARYRAAVAELPLDVRPAESPRDAIAVVPGVDDWPAAALAAVGAGARAVVVHGPTPAALDALAGLSVPIVLDRPLLRTDVADDAPDDAAPVALVAECAAAGGILPLLCDAVGWLRILGRASLAVRAATATGGGMLALLDAGGTAATLTLTDLTGRRARSRLRITAVGETRVEVVAGSDVNASLVVSSSAGRLHLPSRFETTSRLALRRALLALPGGGSPDLDGFRHDAGLARALLRADSGG